MRYIRPGGEISLPLARVEMADFNCDSKGMRLVVRTKDKDWTIIMDDRELCAHCEAIKRYTRQDQTVFLHMQQGPKALRSLRFGQFQSADDKFMGCDIDPTDGNLAKAKFVHLILSSAITPEALSFLDETMAKVVVSPFQAHEKDKGLWIPTVNDTEYRVKIVQSTIPPVIFSPTMTSVQLPVKSMYEPTQHRPPRFNSSGSPPSFSDLTLSPPENVPDDWEQLEDNKPKKHRGLNLSEFLNKNGRELLTAASSSFAPADWFQGFRPPEVTDETEFPSLAGISSPSKKSPPSFPLVVQPSDPVSPPADVVSTPLCQSDPPGPVPNTSSLGPMNHLLHSLTLPSSLSMPLERVAEIPPPLGPPSSLFASISLPGFTPKLSLASRVPRLFTPQVVAQPSPERELAKAAEAWFKRKAVEIEEVKQWINDLWEWVDPYEGRGEMLKLILTFACTDTRTLLVPLERTTYVDFLAHIRRKFCFPSHIPDADVRAAYRDTKGRLILVGDEEDWRIAKGEARGAAAELQGQQGPVMPELDIECEVVVRGGWG